MIRVPQIAILSAILSLTLGAIVAFALDQPEIKVSSSAGPRTLEDQTKTAVVRDYLAAWQTMARALQDNSPGPLDAEFVGAAREKLGKTIEEQQKSSLQTRYQDRSHDIKLVFYSPEGLSVQLLDTVEYDVEILDQGKQLAIQHVRAHYIAVLSPTEVRWKVRILQSTAN